MSSKPLDSKVCKITDGILFLGDAFLLGFLKILKFFPKIFCKKRINFYNIKKIMRIFSIIFSIFILVAVAFGLRIFFHGPFQNAFLQGDLYGYFPIFGEFFGVQLIYNTGIAFGLPVTGLFLKVLTFAIIAIL